MCKLGVHNVLSTPPITLRTLFPRWNMVVTSSGPGSCSEMHIWWLMVKQSNGWRRAFSVFQRTGSWTNFQVVQLNHPYRHNAVPGRGLWHLIYVKKMNFLTISKCSHLHVVSCTFTPCRNNTVKRDNLTNRCLWRTIFWRKPVPMRSDFYLFYFSPARRRNVTSGKFRISLCESFIMMTVMILLCLIT